MLTPNTEDWDPHSTSYEDKEFGMMDYKDDIKRSKVESDHVWISYVNQSTSTDLDTTESLIMKIDGVQSKRSRETVTPRIFSER